MKGLSSTATATHSHGLGAALMVGGEDLPNHQPDRGEQDAEGGMDDVCRHDEDAFESGERSCTVLPDLQPRAILDPVE